MYSSHCTDNATEIGVHQTTKVNYLVARGARTTRIENIDATVQDIAAPNPVLKTKAAAVEAFQAIENQPVRWNYLTQINIGATVNGAPMILQSLAKRTMIAICMVRIVTKAADIEKIGAKTELA